MIEFINKNDVDLTGETVYKNWIERVIQSEDKVCGDISYTFCNDAELDKLNQQYLNHTDYTDIISFDATVGSIISGDIFISTERVRENALTFNQEFEEELKRVMIHGVLHYCGYKDKTEAEARVMRQKEAEKLKMFHVEHS